MSTSNPNSEGQRTSIISKLKHTFKFKYITSFYLVRLFLVVKEGKGNIKVFTLQCKNVLRKKKRCTECVCVYGCLCVTGGEGVNRSVTKPS